ncbi:hypothetical protein IV203_017227 [Nitzschia inconspicua]|uniref:Uncharacterized protein n=1 Tax=Nitzschia inconspicua TaxID=303405 RepID=A0A9K3PI57_9STRA|nr:hypothetical protein IV203_017227 [Nitzschia inconspicua]
MNSAVENSAVENTGAEEDSESPLAKRAKSSSRDDALPPELDGLREKEYRRITSAEVVLDKDHSAHGFKKGERYSMAMSIASEDGDQLAIDIMERMAISFELIQQSTCSANESQMRLAAIQEAGILEKRLQRADDGSPLRPEVRARMQAKLEKLYDDLY